MMSTVQEQQKDVATTTTMTKEDIANRLRELLGVDIKFEKLSKDELSSLFEVLTNVWKLAEAGVKNVRDRFKNMGEKEFLDRPLKDILNRPVIQNLLQRRGGILGFGIFEIPPKQQKKAEETPSTTG